MVKQLYLCSKCKKAGVKSSKAKMFESFFCPNCNQNRTLFLPEPKKESPRAVALVVKDPPKVMEELPWGVPLPPEIPKIQLETNIIKNNNFISIWDVFIFVMGFISALLVMKIR